MICDPKPEIAKEILGERIPSYYPGFQGLRYTIKQVPFGEDSTYPLYQFSARDIYGSIHKTMVVKFAPIYDDNNEGETEYKNLSFLYEKFKTSNKGVHVARPLDFFDDINALITEKVDGERLNKKLLRLNSIFTSKINKEALLRDIEKCGCWLRLYHQFTKQKRKPALNEEFVTTLKKKMLTLEKFGFPHNITEKVVRFVNEISSIVDLHELNWAGQHGDFGPQNIVVSQKDIYVFDLQRYKPEIVFNDVAYFLVTLETINTLPKYPLYDFRYTKMLQKAFIAGYFDTESYDLMDVKHLLLSIYYLKHLIYRCDKQRNNIAEKGLKSVLTFFDLLKTSRHYPNRVKRLLNEIQIACKKAQHNQKKAV